MEQKFPFKIGPPTQINLTLQSSATQEDQKPNVENPNRQIKRESATELQKPQLLESGALSIEKSSVPLQPQKGSLKVSQSEPKLRSIKDEILKIPKVKQILNKDKFIYQQDIEKRLELIGDVKNQNYEQKELQGWNGLRKDPLPNKKKRRHKTSYKVPLTKKNIQSMNNLITAHISHNQKYKNEHFVFLSENDYKEPFDLKKLEFMDEINPLKRKYKEKFPDLKEGVLAKNKLLLQHVILNRNVKRQIKLDEKKSQKKSTGQLLKLSEGLEPVKQQKLRLDVGMNKKGSAKKENSPKAVHSQKKYLQKESGSPKSKGIKYIRSDLII